MDSLQPGSVLTDICQWLSGVRKALFTFVIKHLFMVCNQKSSVAILINYIINNTRDGIPNFIFQSSYIATPIILNACESIIWK